MQAGRGKSTLGSVFAVRPSYHPNPATARKIIAAPRKIIAAPHSPLFIVAQSRANGVKDFRLALQIRVQEAMAKGTLGVDQLSFYANLEVPRRSCVLVALDVNPGRKLVEDQRLGRAKARPVPSSSAPLNRNLDRHRAVGVRSVFVEEVYELRGVMMSVVLR